MPNARMVGRWKIFSEEEVYVKRGSISKDVSLHTTDKPKSKAIRSNLPFSFALKADNTNAHCKKSSKPNNCVVAQKRMGNEDKKMNPVNGQEVEYPKFFPRT